MLNLSEKSMTISPWKISEVLGILLALIFAFHFLSLRVHAGGLPGGDEGSWLSVAAEVSRGHGFITHWLEGHFLQPYTLPRPDDFRYPALTSLLALNFYFFGISIDNARWMIVGIFLLFAVSTYLLSRSAFGPWPAMAALWTMAFSLLQLQWNSIVYTEGLFGIGIVLLAAWYLRGERTLQISHRLGFLSYTWWFILGLVLALLFLIRPNGLLFLSGIPVLFWTRKKCGLTWKHPLFALLGFLFLASPWLIRTAYHFGNPFHIAGNAGMLRLPGESHTLSVHQFLDRHGILFPVVRLFIGCKNFFMNLHYFEHGLEIIPLVLSLYCIVKKQKFFSPGLLAGYLLMLAACMYSAYDSWAGVRYMSALLPLFYAYGFSAITQSNVFKYSMPNEFQLKFFPLLLSFGLIGLILLPVINPHRFYERKYSNTHFDQEYLNDHLKSLKEIVPENSNYYAASLCKINFFTENRGCIGLQELYDPTWFARSIQSFQPKWVFLTQEEMQNAELIQALSQMKREGYTQDTLRINANFVYLNLRQLE